MYILQVEDIVLQILIKAGHFLEETISVVNFCPNIVFIQAFSNANNKYVIHTSQSMSIPIIISSSNPYKSSAKLRNGCIYKFLHCYLNPFTAVSKS